MFSLVVLVPPTDDSPAPCPTLARALQSVAVQTLPAWEVLLADRSRPGPAARAHHRLAMELAARSGRPVHYLPMSGDCEGRARNEAAAAALGRQVGFLDARDELLPLALEQYRHRFDGDGPTVAFGRGVGRTAGGVLRPSVDSRWPEGDLLAAAFAGRVRIDRSAFVADRQVLRRTPFDETGAVLPTLDFVLRAAARWPFRCVQEDVTITLREPPADPVAHGRRLLATLDHVAAALPDRIAADTRDRILHSHMRQLAWEHWRAGRRTAAHELMSRLSEATPRHVRHRLAKYWMRRAG